MKRTLSKNSRRTFKATTSLYNFERSYSSSSSSNSTSSDNSIKKTTQLRNLLRSDKLEFICEAHNGLSARIVEEAGFKGIWGSGLSISASLGVRDANEASWTQVLETLEFMSDRTSIPILLDGDTGYGNFNNARRLIQKLESRNIAGVCLEDKLFPKTNSLLDDVRQPLADISEFSGKIRACKDTQKDPDFVVVARVESFIAGWGLDDALKRSISYKAAGADAILMHSKRGDVKEIAEFMKEWNSSGKNPCPVVVVPTKYYKTPTEELEKLGCQMIIWANHNLRSCITAMQETCKELMEKQNLVGIEKRVASVNEVFRLQSNDELLQAEKKYLPKE